jgi:hypothetical protein
MNWIVATVGIAIVFESKGLTPDKVKKPTKWYEIKTPTNPIPQNSTALLIASLDMKLSLEFQKKLLRIPNGVLTRVAICGFASSAMRIAKRLKSMATPDTPISAYLPIEERPKSLKANNGDSPGPSLLRPYPFPKGVCTEP